eukprot:GILI01019508.1.p1 GENE.GILI01019508.1~~GILI01019508.1.p1  ORF type:complete len:286 (+),score=55.80 GILI01019508.1:124-858(+)
MHNFTFTPPPMSDIVYPVGLGASFVVFIKSLQYFMRNRDPISLKTLNIIHNIFLCLLSLAMCAGTIYAVFWRAMKHGFFNAYCDPDYMFTGGDLWFWYHIFYWSKYYEFFDTVFLALKKKDIIFLHIYHHAVTPLFCWFFLHTVGTYAWISTVLNGGIHVAMYYYYAIASMGYSVWWKRYITQAQLIQFFTGIACTIPAMFLNCRDSLVDIYYALFQGFVFIVLFSLFYRKTYKKGEQVNKKSQ